MNGDETPAAGAERQGIPGADVPGVVTGLAELPRDAHLDAQALGDILGRCRKSVARAWRRGELPPPVMFMGRHVWVVGAILDHFQKRQKAAVRRAHRREEKSLRFPLDLRAPGK